MIEPIRVLQIMGILNFGGAENMVMNLYRTIDRKQIQFDFVVHTNECGAFDDEVKQLGGKIYHAPRYAGINHLRYVKWWNSFFITHPEYKIIHSHIRSTASIFIPIAHKFGVTAIVHSQNTNNESSLKGRIKNCYQRKIEKVADYRFACSLETGNWLFPSKSFEVIKSGIDCKRFIFSQCSRDEIRKELHLENKFVIGHIGSHTSRKNLVFLLRVFAKIYEKDKDVRLLQLGKGDLTEKLKEECEALKIDNAVIFAGVHSDHERYYSAMDVLVFPSLIEGLPVTLIEAQTNGLNCIVSENITKEADTHAGLFHSMDLQLSVEKWADEVLSFKGCKHNLKAVDYTVNSGFDINETAIEMQNFYVSI